MCRAAVQSKPVEDFSFKAIVEVVFKASEEYRLKGDLSLGGTGNSEKINSWDIFFPEDNFLDDDNF
jgi:hypothetical protein